MEPQQAPPAPARIFALGLHGFSSSAPVASPDEDVLTDAIAGTLMGCTEDEVAFTLVLPGGSARTWTCDLEDEEQIERVVREIQVRLQTEQRFRGRLP